MGYSPCGRKESYTTEQVTLHAVIEMLVVCPSKYS